jgi:hypothetical protein
MGTVVAPGATVEMPITVLNIGGTNNDVQQETQRIDQDVPLATLDLSCLRRSPKDQAQTPF